MATVTFVFVVFLISLASITTSELLNSEPLYSSDDSFHQNTLLTTVHSKRFRLPLSVIPYHYKLQMMPILEPLPGFARFTAPGKVQISIECLESTQRIILHALNLTIDHSSVQVTHIDNGAIGIVLLSYDLEKDFFIIDLNSGLITGEKYEISIDFIAPIPQDRLNGMYLDYYDDPNTGDRRYVATTLFAPYHSRRAFPNFDEPNFRATYDISLGRHENYHAMSNSELIESYPMENFPNWHWDTFNTTPSISSYIIAMIVSDFTFEEAPPESSGDKTVRIYAPYYLIDRGAGIYSSKLTADVLNYFEEYFIIKYPLPKMYSIALPHFFFNAMENWGLITYKDPVLLYLQNETSEAERYKINYVVSHELGHQWFGNLVNCQWWAYVWLKEGFASFYAHYGINHTHPELEPWTQFVPNMLQVALNFDASNATHPLENFPETSAAVADIYTRIPYEKGASILRMTSSFLSEDVFTHGVRLYVDRFQYKGAVQDDVFQALQEAVDSLSLPMPTDMKSIMDTWTRQSGFPLIRTAVINDTTLQLTQEKYILDDPSSPDDTWWVPITLLPKLSSSIEPDMPDLWIPQGTRSVNVTMNTGQLIIVNPESTGEMQWEFPLKVQFFLGYYRVLYDDESFQNIAKVLMNNHQAIPPVARSQILDDYFSFAKAEYVPYDAAMHLTEYLENEEDLAVWKTVIRYIKQFYSLLSDTKYSDQFSSYFSPILDRILDKLDINTQMKEIGSKAILISELMEVNCLLSRTNSLCWEYAKFYAKEWRNNPEYLVPVNLQTAVYCGMVKNDDFSNSNWNVIYQKYVTEFSAAHRSRLARALTCTMNEENQKWLLTQIFSDETKLHEHDKIIVLQHSSANSYSKQSILEFLDNSDNYEFGKIMTVREFSTVLTTLSGSLNKIAELNLIERVLESNSGVDDKDALLITKVVQNNINWVDQFAESMNEWLEKHANSVDI